MGALGRALSTPMYSQQAKRGEGPWKQEGGYHSWYRSGAQSEYGGKSRRDDDQASQSGRTTSSYRHTKGNSWTESGSWCNYKDDQPAPSKRASSESGRISAGLSW